MLRSILKGKDIILASGSPRRQNFFKELDIDFRIDVRSIDEQYPHDLQREAITDYLVQQKANAFPDLKKDQILITSDTIVWHEGAALNKPESRKEAVQMISSLSGKTHEVITSVAMTTAKEQKIINDNTKVSFKNLSSAEIDYYIDHYEPYDKAGGYGIQEWFGYIAVTRIEGSYFNVMGMPLHKVYETLSKMGS